MDSNGRGVIDPGGRKLNRTQPSCLREAHSGALHSGGLEAKSAAERRAHTMLLESRLSKAEYAFPTTVHPCMVSAPPGWGRLVVASMDAAYATAEGSVASTILSETSAVASPLTSNPPTMDF